MLARVLFTFGVAGLHLARVLSNCGLVALHLAWVFFLLLPGYCLLLAGLAYIWLGSCLILAWLLYI